MSSTTKLLTSVFVSTTLIFVAQTTQANKDSNIQQRLSKTKINLQQAVHIAEAHQGGQAYEAELDGDRFSLEYEVKVISQNNRFKIIVDGVTGEIKRVREYD